MIKLRYAALGPYVTSPQIWNYLSSDDGTDTDRHLCFSCFAKAGPAVCEAVSKGLLCADPFCGRVARGRCPCCQKPNCGNCLYSSLLDGGGGTSLGRSIPVDKSMGPGIEAPSVCMSCFGEYRLTNDDLSPVEVRDALTLGGKRRKWERATKIAEARAADVALRWKRQLANGCRGPENQPFPIIPS
jgi:hypothetical protein